MNRSIYLLLIGILLTGSEVQAQIDPEKYQPTLEKGEDLFYSGAFIDAANAFRTARFHAPFEKYPKNYIEASDWIIRADSSLILLLSRREAEAQRAKKNALAARDEAVDARKRAERNEIRAKKAELVADSARRQAEADQKASIARHLAFGSIGADTSETALNLAYYALASEVKQDTFYAAVRQAFGDAVYRQSHTRVGTVTDGLLIRDFICSPTTDQVLVLSAQQLADTVAGPDQLHMFSLSVDSSDHRLSLADIATSYELPKGYRVSTIAFATDGRRFVTGSVDGRLILWATHSPLSLAVAELSAPTPIHEIVFSGSQHFLIATESGAVERWSTEMDRLQLVAPMTSETKPAPVYAIGFSADGSRFYTRGAASSIGIWSGTEGKPIARLAPIPVYAYEAAFSSDGSQLLVADATGKVGWWDIATEQLLDPLSSLPDQPTHFAFAPGGDQFYVAGKFGHLVIQETVSKQQIAFHFGTETTAADFLTPPRPDTLLPFLQTSLLIGFADGSVSLVDTAPNGKLPFAADVENRILMKRKIASDAAIRKVMFSASGKYWLALDEAGRLTVCRNYRAAYQQLNSAPPELSCKQQLRYYGKCEPKKISR